MIDQIAFDAMCDMLMSITDNIVFEFHKNNDLKIKQK